jgi:hypothetical protein
MTVSNAPSGFFSPHAEILLVPGGLLCVSPTDGRLAQSKELFRRPWQAASTHEKFRAEPAQVSSTDAHFGRFIDSRSADRCHRIDGARPQSFSRSLWFSIGAQGRTVLSAQATALNMRLAHGVRHTAAGNRRIADAVQEPKKAPDFGGRWRPIS